MFRQDTRKWNQIQFKILVMPNKHLIQLKMPTIVWLWMLPGLILILRKYRMNLLIQLLLVARMLNMKEEHHMSQREFDDIAQLIKEVVPYENLVTENFYSAKRLVRGLGLSVKKIHCCNNGCMLFWGEDNDLTICKICGHQRYKRPTRAETDTRRKTNVPYKKIYYFPLSPRLLRLYASKATANDMRWHVEHEVVEG